MNIYLYEIILLIIIMYYINILLSSTERFDTYFQPFYTSKFDDLYNFYDTNMNNSNYFKKQFYYNKLNIGYSYDKELNRHITSVITSKSSFTHVNLIKYKQDKLIINDLLNKQIDLTILPSPFISNLPSKHKTQLRTITKVIQKSVYFITLQQYNITSIKNIPYKENIGIINNDSSLPFILSDVITANNYKMNDINIKYYDTYDALFNALSKNEIRLILVSMIYPTDIKTNYINQYILKYTMHNPLILPIDFYNEDIFLKQNFYYNITYTDLNILCPIYLPKNINGQTWTIFNPSLKTLSYYDFLITHDTFNKEYVIILLELFYKYRTILNKYIDIQNNELLISKNLSWALNNPLKNADGCDYFYNEYGFMSYVDDERCKYLVGIKKCDETALKNLPLLML